MTPEKLEKLQGKLGLSGKHLAKLFGVSDTTISLYKSGKMKLSRTSDFMMRMKAFAAFSSEERDQHLQSVLCGDVDYQRMLLRETGKRARALVEQHNCDPILAFKIAHYGHHNFPMKIHIWDIVAAYQNCIGQAPKISKAEFKKMLKLYSERNREEQ